MATAIIGDQGTTPILTNRKQGYDSSGRRITEVYRCAKDNVSWIPAFGTSHPIHTALVLVDWDIDEHKEFSIVVLQYRLATWQAGGGVTTPPADTEIKSADGNAIEIPIEQNPNYDTGWATSKAGVTSYLSPQPVYTYEKVYASFVWSEANIIGTVGTRQAPTGMTSPTANKWLHAGRQIVEQGESVIVRDTYQYAANGWDTDIYD